jgi:hypothetical protein
MLLLRLYYLIAIVCTAQTVFFFTIMEQRIYIPTTFSSKQFECLIAIVSPILQKGTPSEITLDFSKCKFLGHHAVAIIGSLAHYMSAKTTSSLKLDLSTLEPKIHKNLEQNGFLKHMGQGVEPWGGNSIPFRHDETFQKDDLIQYLTSKWLGKGWINISHNLKSLIVTTVLEIYLNAFEHSGSDMGVFSCGQFYPKLRRLQLTILDLGVGIPQNVRSFQSRPDLSAPESIQWALARGNSTKPLLNTARGVGLDTMQQFIRLNQGKLRIYSHGGYVKLSQNPPEYGGQIIPFQGTIVKISLICDEAYYCLPSDLTSRDSPFF